MSVPDTLDQAAAVIEANGFCKWYLYDTNQAAAGTAPCYCPVDLLGAINVALHGSPVRFEGSAGWAAEQALAERVNEPSLTCWPTRPGHGKAEALSLLRQTAAELRAVAA